MIKFNNLFKIKFSTLILFCFCLNFNTIKAEIYNEIRILFGPYLVASAKVNIYRQDVSSAINKEGNFGFCFETVIFSLKR